MFRFAQPEYLYLLLIVPLLVILFVWNTVRRKRKLQSFGDPELLAQYMPNVSLVRPQFKFYLQIVALILLIVALARPQFGVKEQTLKRQGMEVMIALDVSNSMLAQDVAPSRLERSKQLLSKIIDGMTEDKVGLVVFAGDAYTQLPITCDYVSAKMFLSSISPSLVARQGTAIGSAIDLSIKSFGLESTASRAIILITDGENHEDDAIGAAKLAKEKGIQVFVLGVGKPEGSPIPLEGSMSFRKDKDGNVVVSKLNEEMCRQIAQAGGGMYLRVDNTNAAQRTLQQELDKLAKSELETRVYSEYNEQYQSFVIVALILLVIEFFIFGRRNKRLSKINLYK
ncbi:MAG: VWA domain-containing protein [Bacteroidetes bacterium]|uniref:VWA domain-containing protein n=1 Tax=Candidatus Gallipaludibacter merdavium TaxID=2840839 RepID=A0A9D9HV52_9BACT|nr:VWA domain-containing protein [Candidatus Gallipaludibacter merdavium]